MYSKSIRDDTYKTNLTEFISREYGIQAISLREAKRGFYGETWRLETKDSDYFVKVDYSGLHKFIFRDGLAVIDHLRKHGISFIPEIMKTRTAKLFSYFEGAVLGIFEWVDGENIQNDETTLQEYQMLAKIYTVPVKGLQLPQESFDTISINGFMSLRERLKTLDDDVSAKDLLQLLDIKSELIGHYSERLPIFAKRCKPDEGPFYITHGDAGGNIITGNGKAYIVDWDEPKLAAPERDAWFYMRWSGAMDSFHDSLRQNGLTYTLKSERMAYYCYHYFFYYLTEYFNAFLDLPERREALLHDIQAYFDGWIKDNLQYADQII